MTVEEFYNACKNLGIKDYDICVGNSSNRLSYGEGFYRDMDSKIVILFPNEIKRSYDKVANNLEYEPYWYGP